MRGVFSISTHTINVWCIYLHVVDVYVKCGEYTMHGSYGACDFDPWFSLGFMRKVAGCHVLCCRVLTGRYSLWKSVVPAGAKLQPFQFHGWPFFPKTTRSICWQKISKHLSYCRFWRSWSPVISPLSYYLMSMDKMWHTSPAECGPQFNHRASQDLLPLKMCCEMADYDTRCVWGCFM